MFRLWRRFASAREPSPRERALALLRSRRFDLAASAFDALLTETTAPRERAFLLNKRGVAYIGMKQTELARTDFIFAIAYTRDYAPAITNLGNLSLEAGDVEAAIARYEEAIVADPAYALAHLNLAAAYKRAGRFTDAVRALRRALALEQPTSLFRRRPR
jgi:tetratricopeptide (TPR) repeat protein